MVLLTKVTCSYSGVEDRIRMSALQKDGEPVLFWLTQRLSCQLVHALTSYLERSVSQSSMVDPGLLLSCKQRDAEWKHEPSEPVSYSEASNWILPEKVDMSFSDGHAVLVFPFGDGKGAQLRMSLQELRQWLGIMYRQFKHAGWSMEIWPGWFMYAEPGRN